MTQIEIIDRPTRPGLYWLQMQLPQKMSYSTASSWLNSNMGKKTLGGGSYYGSLHWADGRSQGIRTFVTPSEAQQAIQDRNFSTLSWKNGIVALLGSDGLVDSIGCYFYTEENKPLPHGLQDTFLTVIERDGNIVRQEDSSGRSVGSTQDSLGVDPGTIATIATITLVVFLVDGILGIFGDNRLGNVKPKAYFVRIGDNLGEFAGAVKQLVIDGVKAAGDYVGGAIIDSATAVASSNLGKVALWGVGGYTTFKFLQWMTRR